MIVILCYPYLRREVYASTCNFEWKSLKEIMHIELVKIEYHIKSLILIYTQQKRKVILLELYHKLGRGARGWREQLPPPP